MHDTVLLFVILTFILLIWVVKMPGQFLSLINKELKTGPILFFIVSL